MGIIRLIEGPVGAGKSTFASQISKDYEAPRLILDDWIVTLFTPDRPSIGFLEWYLERKRRCIEQIWKLSCDFLVLGSDVILELGLIQQSDRGHFFDRVDATGHDMKIYVLDASPETRRERVLNRNIVKGETYSMQVSEQIFNMANTMWEPIEDFECRNYEVEFISTEV